MSFILRPRRDDLSDEAMLFELYASTRAEEMTLVDWNQEQKDQFLRFQFSAQERAYQNDYPGSLDRIIEVNGQPAGRLLTWRTENALCLLDIALLPAFRGQGIGKELVRVVMAQGEQEAILVWLYVMFSNPGAERLYKSLGFVRREMVGPYFIMDWHPTTLASIEN